MISSTATIAELAERVRQLEHARRLPASDIVSTGSPPLDALLPERGLRRGTLVEWLGDDGPGGGAALALLTAKPLCQRGGLLVVVDREETFYPPAVVGWGLDLTRLVVLRPRSQADALWSWDQALRSPAVGAVWASSPNCLRRWRTILSAVGNWRPKVRGRWAY